jgi:hypothetical protein
MAFRHVRVALPTAALFAATPVFAQTVPPTPATSAAATPAPEAETILDPFSITAPHSKAHKCLTVVR